MKVSVFNDVIGPVMRGASSSHCAAALRIGRIARNLMNDNISNVVVQYDSHGSLATTHKTQCSDMGLDGGLMGWDVTDERLPDSPRILAENGIDLKIEYKDFHDEHPNIYRLQLSNATEHHTLTALSTGGGIIKIIEIDEIPLSMCGDYWETLVWFNQPKELDLDLLAPAFKADDIQRHQTPAGSLLQIKAQRPIDDEQLAQHLGTTHRVRRCAPVLPVMSRTDTTVPFTTATEMFETADAKTRPLWELAIDYESARGNLSRKDVLDRMVEIVRILRTSIAQGIAGTDYADRILGYQSGAYAKATEAGILLGGPMLNRIVLNVTALMEVKSSMGLIVAAPTAGACAALPGACIGAAETLECNDEETAKAMLAAGIIGVFIATRSTFSAEVCGCQVECGAGASRGAAALCTLAGGTAWQSATAATMALQNSLGMICDPIGNRVEVPCLGKNVMAASNALSSANMALAGYDPVIPLDEVIETMDRVGHDMPREICCTGLGGLCLTPTAKKIKQRLEETSNENGGI